MIVIVFFVLFLVFVIMSIPIAFSLGISTLIVLSLTGAPIGVIPQRIWTGLDKFVLIAIPFFILAGELMSSSGILTRLLDFARLLVGGIKGGLLHMNILVSMLFGGINGSAVADTSAVGSMLIPATSKEYKDPDFAAAVTACSSVVGPIIPPSLPMLIYAFVAGNVSIAALFLSGIVPGIMLGLGLMGITHIIILRKNYPRVARNYSLRDVVRILRRFFIAMFLPIIMVGGIVSGVFTPTESGCIAVVYALVIGIFVTRELTLKKIYTALIRATIITSVVFLMISIANISTWWLSVQQVPIIVSIFIQKLTSDPNIFLLLIIIFFLIVGLFIEAAAAMIMLVPVLLPLAMNYGINPIQFGLITILGLLIGLVTPPVALCLFIASGIADVPIEKVFKASLPLIILEIAVLFIVAYFPQLYLWVPNLFGYGA